jgi:hypothetical protein
MNTQTPPKHRKTKGVISLLAKHGLDENEIRWRETYSGRWMFSRTSPLAFVVPIHPDDEAGKVLLRRGFEVDNMGRDYVYYLR